MAIGLCETIDKFIEIDQSVKHLGLHIAYTISWKETTKNFASYPYEEEISKLIEYVKNRYTLDSLKDDKIVRAYRDFFWRLGIDPTKIRPSSEALVRRTLKNEFPRINPVVDAGNIASVYTMIPIGMYDLDKIVPPLSIRFSRSGEKFKPIGGKEEILGNNIPILVDSRNIVVHIYPYRDSVETCVTESTSRIIAIAAGVSGVSKNLLEKAISIIVELLQKIGWNSCNAIVYKV